MPITRAKKEALVADLTERSQRAQAIIFTEYRGLTVAEMTDFRRQLREKAPGSVYMVAKNTLLRLALSQAGLPVPEELLTGPTAVLFAEEDPAAAAKTLLAFAKDHELLKVKGGIVTGQIVDEAGIEALSKLPSREELLATLIATIQAPAQKLVMLLQAPQRDLILTLKAYAEQGAE
ncbi:large subunit ribosomal protein L10 [Ardenticatena maritima]|uniref:Large ribosomal subunit protein uL10 n=1 Tax=Ardenticatena maritima TaxID=872965 RepID=A0A0M8K6B7_9CHLR|nr:50S ribosomal protein L10 [Ardenticatena maritima]GAP61691.1 large subunit ribosomal protein L10 [Ardenticatena maritima]